MLLTNKKHIDLQEWFRNRSQYFDVYNEEKKKGSTPCRMVCNERFVLGFMHDGSTLVIEVGKDENGEDAILNKKAFDPGAYTVDDVKTYIRNIEFAI